MPRLCFSLLRKFEEWLDLRILSDRFHEPFDGLLGDYLDECRESVHMLSEPQKMIQLRPLRSAQPVRICDGYRGDVVPPSEQRHVPARLILEPSKMLVAPVTFDDERNLVVLFLFGELIFAHGALCCENAS